VPAMAFALLPSLHPRERNAVIHVRVCRKWEFRGGTDDGKIVHVDLVLVDQKGNSMYAEIPQEEIKRKSPLVEEGKIYNISRFRVSNAKDTFMPVPGSYMIQFSYHTLAEPVAEDTVAIPELVYHLTPFAQLEHRAGDQSRFTGVLGILVEVTDTKVAHLTNKPNPTITRDIVLRDLTNFEFKVTLWGHRASSFSIDTVYDPNESKAVVILLASTISVEVLRVGGTSILLYREADTFYNSLHSQHIEIRRTAPVVDQPRGPPLAQAEIATLTELDAIDPYTIEVTYPFCILFQYRYKLPFVATDGTTEAHMIAFADVAGRIIGKPVQQLMRAGRPKEDFPPDITALVAMKFTFAIMLADESFDKREKSYQVLSMLASHGRQNPVPHSVTAAGTSKPQAHIDPQRQQHTLEGQVLESSAETEMPAANAAQQEAQALAQTPSDIAQTTGQASQHTPVPSNVNTNCDLTVVLCQVQTLPSGKNSPAVSGKKDLNKSSTAKNTRATARRKLPFSNDVPTEETADSPSAAKKQRGQKTTTAVQIKEGPTQSQKSSTPDDGATVMDATSDTNLE
ncbi:hypothetical protein U9M48_012104, partial [Paspalum notatum var. saurae]